MTESDSFLEAIRAAPNDVAPRLVYADWLDEHGLAGGAFLRAECEWFEMPPGPEKAKRFARLQKAGTDIAPDWLAMVSRVPIENCVEFEFECPKRWELLQVTSDSAVRFCTECQKNVFFCGSIQEAQQHAMINRCVAVDVRLTRKPNDLQPQFEGITMGVILPESRRGLASGR